MILSRNSICAEVEKKRITIEPFDVSFLNANSYNVGLGKTLLHYIDDPCDTAQKNNHERLEIPETGIILDKGSFFVGHIAEYIGSDFYVPQLHCCPHIAQLGLFIHITANLIDIGNKANFSLHLHPTTAIHLTPNMRIAHVSFWQVDGKVELYKGKYRNVRGPAASQSYKHTSKIVSQLKGPMQSTTPSGARRICARMPAR